VQLCCNSLYSLQVLTLGVFKKSSGRARNMPLLSVEGWGAAAVFGGCCFNQVGPRCAVCVDDQCEVVCGVDSWCGAHGCVRKTSGGKAGNLPLLGVKGEGAAAVQAVCECKLCLLACSRGSRGPPWCQSRAFPLLGVMAHETQCASCHLVCCVW
jgi:hypothetical protein